MFSQPRARGAMSRHTKKPSKKPSTGSKRLGIPEAEAALAGGDASGALAIAEAQLKLVPVRTAPIRVAVGGMRVQGAMRACLHAG